MSWKRQIRITGSFPLNSKNVISSEILSNWANFELSWQNNMHRRDWDVHSFEKTAGWRPILMLGDPIPNSVTQHPVVLFTCWTNQDPNSISVSHQLLYPGVEFAKGIYKKSGWSDLNEEVWAEELSQCMFCEAVWSFKRLCNRGIGVWNLCVLGC